MDTPLLIAIAVVAVAIIVVIAVIGWLVARRKRTRRLRETFGAEYDRTLNEEGDRAQAESRLQEREKRVQKLELRPLSAADREYYVQSWTALQTSFVDDPRGSVARAGELIDEIMLKRGYPVADFDQQADDLSVDHPNVVLNYRRAHAVTVQRDTASTEELRDAVVRYRSLFTDLMETRVEEPPAGTPAN